MKFDAADEDNSGSLDEGEVVHLLQQILPDMDLTEEYMSKLMSRFDMDRTGQIEEDEFLSIFKFLMDSKDKTGRGKTAAPSLNHGRVRWLCCDCGPSVHPSKLYRLIRIIMFQNALVAAMIVFNLWQLGSSTAYFHEPDVLAPIGGHVAVQGVMALLQLLHTSLLTLPMYVMVRAGMIATNPNIILFAHKRLTVYWLTNVTRAHASACHRLNRWASIIMYKSLEILPAP